MGRALRSIAAFAIVSVITPITCVMVIIGALIFLPLPATLPEPKPILEYDVNHVLDTDGNEIAVYKHFETFINVDQADIPQVLKDAVVAAEDKHFFDHGGVDIGSTIRALVDDVQNRGAVQGGSTITQQYVKNAFTTGERTIARKIREAILASQLERSSDKQTILYKYLSTIYFGEGAYGVGAAAQTYFRTPVSQLTLSQAAVLASVIPAPSKYSPRVNPALAEQRRAQVLGEMLEQGRIDRASYDAAGAEPIWLAVNGDAPGPATVVYPPQTAQSSQPWFTQYVKDWLEQNLPGCVPDDCPTLDKGGLTIKTTLDPKVQKAAEEEVANAMGNNDLNLQMSLVAVEPPTGFVRAIVGGREFGNPSQHNVATDLPGRQTGSAFKPFVLATALEEGIPLTKKYSGATFSVGGTQVFNIEGEGAGPWDLRSATVHSINAVFARMIDDVGVEKAEEMARRLGVNIAPFDPVNDGVSVALGVKDAKPLEMASAFGVFANHGKRAAPTPVIEVTDSTGKVILDNNPDKAAANAKPVLADVIADNVTDILRGVLVSGTAAGKGLGDRPAAGKTGTSEEFGNAWFVGYTPTLSTAVWMGYNDCNCPLRNINGVRQVFGGTIPASTWQKFMKRALDGVPITEFSQPAPIQSFTDAARRNARHGFDPGPRRYPSGPPEGGPYVVDVPPPDATAPTTSTSTTTTTTTLPGPTTTTILAN
ncbi:MAG: penicillin-binding protein [Acidimicrobiaceae bacterium]